jgi:hypothetical protein
MGIQHFRMTVFVVIAPVGDIDVQRRTRDPVVR